MTASSSPSNESPGAPEPLGDEPQLPPRGPARRRAWWIASAALVAVVGVVLGLTLSSGGGSGGSNTISIGVVDASQPYWKTFAALAEQRLGVTLKFVNFNDYSQVNPALKEGQVDLNEFQHIQYLANYNVTAHDDLQPIGATAVYPLPLYSVKYKGVSALPNGAQVAIPNDAINEARGLLVLQSAGLLTLKDGGTAFSTTSDIVSHKVSVTTLDASQTAGALRDGSVSAAIVNDNYATLAGLSSSQVLYADDPSSASAAPYVNIFVARKADENNATYLALAALYHDPSVEKGVQQANNDSAVFRTVAPAQLQAELATVQKQAAAAQH